MSETNSELLEKISQLEEKLTQIDEKLNRILGIGDDVSDVIHRNTRSCERMAEHINFVENVYSIVRAPLDYIRRNIGGEEELPELEN